MSKNVREKAQEEPAPVEQGADDASMRSQVDAALAADVWGVDKKKPPTIAMKHRCDDHLEDVVSHTPAVLRLSGTYDALRRPLAHDKEMKGMQRLTLR